MRLLAGRSFDVTAFISSSMVPPTNGFDLSQFADKTSSSQQYRPRTLGLLIGLTGGASIQLVCAVRVQTSDGDLGWAIPSDTGNLGVLGGTAGSPLPSNQQYFFLVNALSIHSQFALLTAANTGGVTVAVAKLIEYVDEG